MKEERQEGRVIFHFTNMHSSRLNVLLFLRGFSLVCVSLVIIFAIAGKFTEHPIAFSVALPFCLLLLVAGVRFILKTFDKEYIVITPEMLTIYSRNGLKQKKHDYLLKSIATMAYIGAGKSTDHPLKGNSFDYLGFEARDKEIALVNKTGNISFQYDNRTVLFGRNAYSWDARKISDSLYELSMGSLYIQDLPEEISEMTYKYSS